MTWQPACALSQLKARAELYAQTRAFFHARNVLEVETPMLSPATATDPQLASVPASLRRHLPEPAQNYFLHTSPEFPMKRLLAAGSGPIYQICKTFRDGESGHRHNPEFTMLEWYQPGYDLKNLMQEVRELVQHTVGEPGAEYLSYREAFKQFLDLDPFTISDQELSQVTNDLCGFDSPASRDDYLNLLLAMHIEPHLGSKKPLFLYQYPASQASLAQNTIVDGHQVAERFELYIHGLEIANGYFELTDAMEQRHRFEQDNREREQLGLPLIPLDENLLEAMQVGLPSCAGVALGLDRLLMVQQDIKDINSVLAFPIDRA